ncbi:glycosyltransferase family 4 protein [Thermococcus sp. 2319x1]|uniref:glycosyltransferase family 4 protein n=1 Tax=Thermococcus sp. 2319x1 TaxID=1674923 RepID=UPI001E3FA24A|nr:glycosyltransferase family 4 protein [Thermococcus sp. 2319x1]
MRGGTKIVIISNYGLNSDGGGVKVYTRNLVKALHNRNINIILLIREGTPTNIEEKLPNNKVLYLFAAIRKLNVMKPKFVLSQGGWFTAIPAMLYKILHPETKVVYLYHTHYNPAITIKQKIIRSIERYLMSFVLSKFDCVLFVSRGLKKNVGEVGALNVLSHWGVLYGAPLVKLPTQDEVEEFKQKFNVQKNDLYLLGHSLTVYLSKVRGAKLLIDSLALLPSNVKLILTRKGRFVGELQKYAELGGVKGRVIFTGDLKNPHVATLVADIYTHISYGEGLPLALLEVMRIGKSIIASKVTGIPEAIRHPLEGVLVENEIKKIASTVKHLIENPKLRRKMSVISKGAVNKRFSWEKTAEKLLSFFSCK